MQIHTTNVPACLARVGAVAATMIMAACGTPPGGSASVAREAALDSAYLRSVFGPTWTLVAISGTPAPVGSGDRPATLEFYSGSESRASGFAGCNRWSSSWKRGGADSLAFETPVSTRMACAQGMDLEQRFLGIIGEVRRFRQRDSTLTLFTTLGDSARFVAR